MSEVATDFLVAIGIIIPGHFFMSLFFLPAVLMTRHVRNREVFAWRTFRHCHLNAIPTDVGGWCFFFRRVLLKQQIAAVGPRSFQDSALRSDRKSVV